MSDEKNVLGTLLECCCTRPMTGFFRDGFCRTDEQDRGAHVVCAKMTAQFLAYTRLRGNDLTTPIPEFDFPGLKPGDKWCLGVQRWKEALDAGCAPPVYLAATHAAALSVVSLSDLRKHALDL